MQKWEANLVIQGAVTYFPTKEKKFTIYQHGTKPPKVSEISIRLDFI
jgi:hypothetical protein